MGVTRRALLWMGERRNAQRLIARAPLTWRVAGRFVAGEHTVDAIDAVRRLNAARLDGILNLLGEGVRDPGGIETAVAGYREAIRAAAAAGARTTVSIKPSQMGVMFDLDECAQRLREIGGDARAAEIGLEVDMEQSELVEPTIDAYLGAGVHPAPRLAIQAALHRTPDDVQRLIEAHVPVRLVKGAYLESSQVAIQRGDAITQRYRELATLLLERGNDPAFATHDLSLIRHVMHEARRLDRGHRDYEFQMLFGIRRDLQKQLHEAGFRVSVYVPFGSSWYPYLVRRLAERPANLRFFARALAGG